MWSRSVLGKVLYVVLSTIAISTMANAPGILVGYGLVYVSELYAVLAWKPLTAVSLFTVSHLAADVLLLGSRAVFPLVAVASTLLRPLTVYILAKIRSRLGVVGLVFGLAVLDQLIALTIAIVYYGNDGIHVGLAIYEVLLAPFAYLAYLEANRGSIVGVAASLAGLLAYYLGSYTLFSPASLAAGVVAVMLTAISRRSGFQRYLLVLGTLSAITGIILGMPMTYYNAKLAFYSLEPRNWGVERWAQLSPQCPPISNVFEYTHNPERLRIIDTCVTVEGIVVGAPGISGDGDFSFNIVPRPSYSWMLGLGNLLLLKAALHVEVVPHNYYTVLGPLGGGVCPGDVVRVTGVYVVDTDHGMWTEIHPAYKIVVVRRATSLPWPNCIAGRMLSGTG